ncbi:PREDICTED: uncharacterized protein LOC108566996 [Nicrophorus vespilloides]|uniref:Uncharacterized protein LOC108566996 n=1 Tax=Nicrophorus vespilloides TaxID=110193 RepID=A0ABM1N757_NICVS|nr:PREDICTED: uncharacterized protein LOC108566996 [Nicrophorus vespilloides]
MDPNCGDMILSHTYDKNIYFVPEDVVMHFEPYHFPALRFLFDTFSKKQHGAILNLSEDMIFEMPVAALLCSISKDHDIPSLIICHNDNWFTWLYYLKLYSKLKVFQLTQHNAHNLFAQQEKKVILVLERDLKYLQDYTENDFFLICVENLDTVITSRVMNKLTCFYTIGLTSINPYKNRDQKLLWKMLKWVDPSKAVPFADFAKEDSEMLSQLVEPYTDTWMRLTWIFGFTKPSDEELVKRKNAIRKWCEENNIISQETEAEKKAKKRKSVKNTEEIASTSKKRNAFSQNESNLKLVDFIDETIIDEFSNNWTLDEIKKISKPALGLKRHASDIAHYHDKLHKCIKEDFEEDFAKLQQSSKRKFEEEFGSQEEFDEKRHLKVILGDIKQFFGEGSPPKEVEHRDVEETENLLDVKDFFETAPEDNAKQDEDIFDSSDEVIAFKEAEPEVKRSENKDANNKVVLKGIPELFECIELSPLDFDSSLEIKEDNDKCLNKVKESRTDLNETKEKQMSNKKSKPFEQLQNLFPFSPLLSDDFSDEDEVILEEINDEVKPEIITKVTPKKIITKESILVSIFGEHDEVVTSFRKNLMQRESEIPIEVIDDLTKPWMD